MSILGVDLNTTRPREVSIVHDGTPCMEDYERITQRYMRYSPVWALSCMISRFHLLRLIGKHRPDLLTPAQKRKLGWQLKGQRLFRRWIEWRRAHFVEPER